MQRIITRLEDLSRRARGEARGLLRRLGDAYRERRGSTPSASSTTATPAVTPPEVAAPAPAAPKQNWELRSQADLVDHIEQHYHAGLRRDLPALITEARQVERDHATHPKVPTGLCDVLAAFSDELDSHMLKEETMLFPTLKGAARGGPIDMPMRMMEREHEGHTDQLEHIRELTGNLSLPAEADATWTALYAGLATLETDLREHIYLENNVLFARASGGR